MDFLRPEYDFKMQVIAKQAIRLCRCTVYLDSHMHAGFRFMDDNYVLAKLESAHSQEEFIMCPKQYVEDALQDAARADHWYEHEKKYESDWYDEEADFDD